MTRTARLIDRLKKLGVGKQITLTNGAMSNTEQQTWYRAAQKIGMKVTVKTLPDRVLVIRVA